MPSNAKFTDTEYVIPTLSSAPTSSTLTFTDNGATRSFKVGYMCRVADSSAEHGYKFYQLYNIANGKATWGEISGGGYYETVTVTLKSTVSSSDSKLNGAVVTVKNTMSGEIQRQTWKGTPLVFKIPSVNTYTVSVSIISEYATPESHSYTAGISTSRNVIMTYIKLPLGIYIYDKYGSFTLPENWSAVNNSMAVGVYVGTENSKFVIAPTASSDMHTEWSNSNKQISGVMMSDTESIAIQDYNGEANTDKIIAQLGTGQAPAAEYCRNYTFKNGKKGYLWSLGESQDAIKNKSLIDEAMSAIGGEVLKYDYWTSTLATTTYVWIQHWDSNWVSYESRSNVRFTRAVCAL